MKNEASKLRRKLQSIEQGRTDSVDAILQERGPLRKGTLVTVRRKCGKPRCRCTTGEKHAAKYLSVKEHGKTRMTYVSQAAEARVAKETQRYRRLRKARAQLAKNAQASLDVIDQLEGILMTSDDIRGSTAKTGGKTKKASRKIK